MAYTTSQSHTELEVCKRRLLVHCRIISHQIMNFKSKAWTSLRIPSGPSTPRHAPSSELPRQHRPGVWLALPSPALTAERLCRAPSGLCWGRDVPRRGQQSTPLCTHMWALSEYRPPRCLIDWIPHWVIQAKKAYSRPLFKRSDSLRWINRWFQSSTSHYCLHTNTPDWMHHRSQI